jgi:hypothetical protein
MRHGGARRGAMRCEDRRKATVCGGVSCCVGGHEWRHRNTFQPCASGRPGGEPQAGLLNRVKAPMSPPGCTCSMKEVCHGRMGLGLQLPCDP